ncbi:MFS transporter [uncultured Amnibacterium sp.]|uniref:MFS transporter n=1 Tax=uncultured Amnibacterium sp. TaxID=1631851 RepID=UPI0035CA415D
MRSYGRLLRRRSTSVSLIASLLSAIPVGMWPLAIVLGALAHGGGAAAAGVLAAVFGAGNALGILTQGALLLRLRPTPLLLVSALLALPAALLLQAGTGPLAVGGALLAGASIPAITPAVRGWFAGSLGQDERPGAYALVNVLFQAGVALGPIAAAALAAAGAIAAAPPLAAGCGLAAVALLASARVGRPARTARSAAAGRRAGSARGVAALLGVAAAGGIGIGTLQVLVPVRSGAGVSGAAFAALALAEVAAAVVLGGRVRARHASLLLGLGAAGMAAVYLVLGAGLAAVPAAIGIGLATAAQSLGSALTLDRFIAPARVPAVFGVQIAVLLVGTSAGALLAGALPGAAFAIVAGLLAISSALALLLLRDGTARLSRPGGLPSAAR